MSMQRVPEGSLAKLIGVGGESVQWGHAWAFCVALVASYTAGTLLEFSLAGSSVLVRPDVGLRIASDFLVTAVCVLVALRFIRHQFVGLGTAAVVCTAIMLPIYQSAQGAWFSFFWTFMFLAGLVMGLRWVRPVWLALGVGAALGGMVGRLLPVPESARVIETLLAALAKGALFAAVLWFGLRLAGTREQKLSKGFFVGSWGCGLALSVLGTYLFLKPAHGRPDLSVGLVALIPMLYAAGAMLILIHQMWAAIQDGKARTTPGKAVGLLFVPFFNLYWAFEAYWGFAKDYNAYVQRRSVNARRLPEGLFLAYPILALVSVIPIVFPVTFVVGLIVVWKICDAVNALRLPKPVPCHFLPWQSRLPHHLKGDCS